MSQSDKGVEANGLGSLARWNKGCSYFDLLSHCCEELVEGRDEGKFRIVVLVEEARDELC